MRALAAAALAALIVACGEAKRPVAPPPEAGSAPAPPPVEGDAAPADPTPPAAEADAGAPAATAAPSSAPPAEPADACTAGSAAFEKRVRPKLQACYREGKKKNPSLEGMVRIATDVSTLGKIGSQKVVEKTLPDAVAACMLKAVKAEPFPEAEKCPGKAVIIPIQFPTKPHAAP